MELMLDTANLAEIRYGLENWPICGVTSNPSILKKEGDIDVYARLAEIKALLGTDKTLHVQVVSTEKQAIIDEAHHILDRLGKDVCIKIPVSAAGIGAIKALAAEGVTVTATAIYSAMQGILAVLAGAKYIAVYYNRMQNNCSDPDDAIAQIRNCIDENGPDAKILAASFKNVNQLTSAYAAGQLTSAYAAGSQSATVPFDLVATALCMAAIDKAVDDFTADFEKLHGKNATMATI